MLPKKDKAKSVKMNSKRNKGGNETRKKGVPSKPAEIPVKKKVKKDLLEPENQNVKRMRPSGSDSERSQSMESITEITETQDTIPKGQVAPVIVSLRENNGKKLGKMAACLYLATEYGIKENLKFMPKGDILIPMKDKETQDKILDLKEIKGFPIVVSLPKSVEYPKKGIIKIGDILTKDELDEFEMEMQDSYGAIKVEHLLKKVNGDLIKTDSLVIHFSVKIPDRVMYGPMSFPVRAWVQKPRLCSKCQLHGHTEGFCKSRQIVCGKCATQGHKAEECSSEEIKCRNCKSTQHKSGDHRCEKYQEQIKINQISASQGTTWMEAKKTYLEAAKTGDKKVEFEKKENKESQNEIKITPEVVLTLFVEAIRIASQTKTDLEKTREIAVTLTKLYPEIEWTKKIIPGISSIRNDIPDHDVINRCDNAEQ